MSSFETKSQHASIAFLPLPVILTVNGETADFNVATVSDLIRVLEITGRYAVERNGEIVPRSEHASTQLEANDRLEVVQAIGGG